MSNDLDIWGPDKTPKTKEDHEEDLRVHHHELCLATDRFDRGEWRQIKIMAPLVQLLVRDTSENRSLLTRIGRAPQTMLSTAFLSGWMSYTSEDGSVHQKIQDNLVDLIFQPPYVFRAPLKNRPLLQTPFEEWWEKQIIIERGGFTLNRRQLVHRLRNEDGIAHVDEFFSREMLELKNGYTVVSDQPHPRAIGPHYGSMRQIAYEVLCSIEAECRDILDGN